MVFLVYAFFGPFDGDPMIAREGFHPVLVVGRTLAQDLLADDRNADDLMEEVDHPLGARQPVEVAVYDDAVEAVVDEGQQVTKQLGEQFHGKPREAQSGWKNRRAWRGQTDRGRHELSADRRGALYPAS